MPTAILTGPPVAGSTLESDLRSLGFTVRTAAAPADVAALLTAVPARERAAVVDHRFTGHLHSLRLGLTDPRFPAAAVPGAVTAQPAARAALADAARGTPAPDELAAALEAGGTAVHRPELGVLVAAVPRDAQALDAARAATAAVDEEDVRLRSAVKSRDGFFTTFFISPYSRYVARWCARRGLTPNHVTTASLLVALVAAGCAAAGTRASFVAAGVLLLASFVLDCADGQLARYALRYSTLGAWLDATFDRAKEYAFYAGLALGAARGGDDVWALALGAMVVQTVRHVVDFSFAEADRYEDGAGAGAGPTAALSGRLDGVGWTVWARRMVVLPIGERWALIAVLTALTTPRTTFLVLLAGCLLAACYTTAGRVLRSVARRGRRTAGAARALADLADGGPLAELAARAAPPLRGLAPVLAGVGAVAVPATALWSPAGGWLPVWAAAGYALLSGWALARPLTGRLDWLVPPLFRAAEYGTVLALAAVSEVNGALPAAFCLVAAVAYHHYDTVYRIRGGSGAPPRPLVRAAGGQEGRTLLVAVAAALWSGGPRLPAALSVLAGIVALVVLAESIRFWVSAAAPAVHDETGVPA
ncbi:MULTISPECIES: DUF5941 domain-containing protein [Streptomyces]|uniref:DUF5941 domain-containing protein n=1 Tax=Streptomyces TaxID=1883 RepID=UPI0022491B20|nr:DUF5941 domain-containing protein [Streptomyces sp. JHD 1]MCX2970672.1 DUF5941 domain-containing protein [Streptomyces sp. JHD 1]